MHESMGMLVNKDTIKLERLLPGPIERVWKYWTEAELLTDWLMPGSIENKPSGLIEFISPPVPDELVPGLKPHSSDIVSRGLI